MDDSKRQTHRRRTWAQLVPLIVIGVGLLAEACTGSSSAGSGSDVAPSPAAPSQEPVCHHGAIQGSNGLLSCGGNIGFRGLSPAYSVAIQADGRIVVVGGTGMYTGGGYDNNFAVARYELDGSPDRSFGDGGQVAVQLRPLQEAHSVAIQEDGRIVVAGSASYGGKGAVSLARYNSDGTPDTTFSEDGWVVVPWVGRGHAVAVQPDGGLVVAGEGSGVALARFRPDGTLDPTFGSDGLVTTSPSRGPNIAYAMVVQPDGRIVVAGRAAEALLLARYEPNGGLDPTFGTNGLATENVGPGPDIGYGVAVQTDGRIVVAGRTASAIFLARFMPNGSPEGGFGRGGRTITDVTPSDDVGQDVEIRADGEIVVVGGVEVRLGSPPRPLRNGRSAVLLYRAEGALDPSFGQRGLARSAFGEKQGIAYSVATSADDVIVVAGLVGSSYRGRFGLARYFVH